MTHANQKKNSSPSKVSSRAELIALFDSVHASSPTTPALIDPDQVVLTYEELHSNVKELARVLSQNSSTPRISLAVGVCFSAISAAEVVAVMSSLLAGRPWVPLLQQRFESFVRMLVVLRDSVDVLICDEGTLPVVAAAAAEVVAAAASVEICASCSLTKIIVLDADGTVKTTQKPPHCSDLPSSCMESLRFASRNAAVTTTRTTIYST